MQRDVDKSLLGLNLHELSELMAERGEPAYRANQIFQSLYRQRVSDLDVISTLPQSLRMQLAQQYSVCHPKLNKSFNQPMGRFAI